jgi:hypothetical protein
VERVEMLDGFALIAADAYAMIPRSWHFSKILKKEGKR